MINWVRKHIMFLFIMITTFIGLMLFYGFAYEIRQNKAIDYDLAINALEKGYANTAIDYFSDLGSYQDSPKYLVYSEAILALQTDQYDIAMEHFLKLGNFEDSKKFISYIEGILALKNKEFKTAIEIFEALGNFQDSIQYLDEIKMTLKELEQEAGLPTEGNLERQQYDIGCSFLSTGNYAQACSIFLQLEDYEDSKNLFEEAENRWRLQLATTISAGIQYSGGVREDGTVAFSGRNFEEQHKINGWTDIVSVSAGSEFFVGLKNDGTVNLAFRKTDYPYRGLVKVEDWKNIVAISSGDQFIVGLKSDGSMVSTGIDGYGETKLDNWKNIISIDTGWQHTVGLDQDGQVHIAGFRAEKLKEELVAQGERWTDIVAISTGGSTGTENYGRGHIVGLRKDGSVVAIGDNNFEQCNVTNSKWSNIVAISAGDYHTVGLTKDGRVLTTQTVAQYPDSVKDISEWANIISISAGYGFTLAQEEIEGHKTMKSAGLENNGQRQVSSWDDIR